METEFKIYMAAWGTALLVGAVVFVIKRKTVLPTCPGYFKFLTMPWKVITFVIATSGLTIIGGSHGTLLGMRWILFSCPSSRF